MKYTNSFLSGSEPSVVIYSLIAMFFIYSFIGWIWECLYVWVSQGRLYNRGFLTGPIIPIYGLGGMGVVVGLGDFRDNIIALFFSGLFICTLLEYLTALICEKIFHTKLWDYSNMKFNLQGRICLAASLMWGVMSVILITFVQPQIEARYMSIPRDLRLVASSCALTLLAVDVAASIISIYNLHDRIAELTDIDSKLREFEAVRNFEDKAQERNRRKTEELREISEEREKQRTQREEELREKLANLRTALTQPRRLETRQRRILKAMPQLEFNGMKDQLDILKESARKRKK